MLWNSEDDGKTEKKAPWVIGAFMVAIMALGVYMNFGSSWHAQPDAEISARAKAVAE
jgi:hypothetical protein